jgi:hypothetical protein
MTAAGCVQAARWLAGWFPSYLPALHTIGFGAADAAGLVVDQTRLPGGCPVIRGGPGAGRWWVLPTVALVWFLVLLDDTR